MVEFLRWKRVRKWEEWSEQVETYAVAIPLREFQGGDIIRNLDYLSWFLLYEFVGSEWIVFNPDLRLYGKLTVWTSKCSPIREIPLSYSDKHVGIAFFAYTFHQVLDGWNIYWFIALTQVIVTELKVSFITNLHYRLTCLPCLEKYWHHGCVSSPLLPCCGRKWAGLMMIRILWVPCVLASQEMLLLSRGWVTLCWPCVLYIMPFCFS